MFGDINLCKDLVLRDYKIITDNNNDKDNSPKSNPAAPQLITNSNDKNDNSVKVNPGNSPKPNSGKDNNLSETKSNNNVKTIKFENKEEDGKNNPTKSSSAESDNKVLVIDLKDIKKITLRADGKLEIEFNNAEGDNYTISQVIADEQINNNQTLQKAKNFLEKSKQNSLSQSELTKLTQNNSTSTNPTKNPECIKAV
jgi:hypothetical protein